MFHDSVFVQIRVFTQHLNSSNVFLPPGTVSSLPAGRIAETRCDDCSSYSGRWCPSKGGRPVEWWSSAPENFEPAPWCPHHSPPGDEDDTGVHFQTQTTIHWIPQTFDECFLWLCFSYTHELSVDTENIGQIGQDTWEYFLFSLSVSSPKS